MEIKAVISPVATIKGCVDSSSGGITPSGTKQISSNGDYDVTAFATASVNVPTDAITEISTVAAMNAVLTAENVGKAYKFVGATGTYTNGDIYVVEEANDTV